VVKLNHPVRIDNQVFTPYLVQGGSVYCIDRKKETTILPVEKFKSAKKKRHLVIPLQATNPIVPVAIFKKEDPVEEIIVIKKVDEEYVSDNNYKIKLSGSAITGFTITEFIAPPVVDNSRYIRPTLEDEYI